MAEIPANTPQDWGMRGATNTTLPQFKGKPRQLIINVDDGYRPVIMDGNTLGGKFKCASVEEIKAIKGGITQEEADARYLGLHAKADNAKMADEAMHASSADTASHADSSSNADEAIKATQDKNGQDISVTYATKQELTTGLGNKLGKTEKAASATVADRANAVAWANVSDKPAATENVKGILQLANASDISTGTDTSKAVTPKQLKDGLNEKLGRNEKASSASVADRATSADRATVANSANSVQWNNVQNRPNLSSSKGFVYSSSLVRISNRESVVNISKNLLLHAYTAARNWGRSFTFPNGQQVSFSQFDSLAPGSLIPKGTKWQVSKEMDVIEGYELLKIIEVN